MHSVAAFFRAPGRHVRRFSQACELRRLEQHIGGGLSQRLRDDQHLRVAVVGNHSIEFAATLRAVRKSGAAAAPVDSRNPHELQGHLAEAQVHLAITAGTQVDSSVVQEAARRLGTQTVTAAQLYHDGLSAAVDWSSTRLTKNTAEPPLMFFSVGTKGIRLAKVPEKALKARLQNAIEMWELTKADVVLSLGLDAGLPTTVIDAMEAPLAVGADVILPVQSTTDVWDMWATLRDSNAVSVVFVSSEWCEKVVDAFGSLSMQLRGTLADRWKRRPFRKTVVMASPGDVPSEVVGRRWADIFGCELVWHYSCAEAGSLFSVSRTGNLHVKGFDWRLADGNLWVRGDGVFESYHGRPRTSAEAFDCDSFCRTGHTVSMMNGVPVNALPIEPNVALDRKTAKHIEFGPRAESLLMKPSWTLRKVLMRKYTYWKTKKNAIKIYSKKHNNSLHTKYGPPVR